MHPDLIPKLVKSKPIVIKYKKRKVLLTKVKI